MTDPVTRPTASDASSVTLEYLLRRMRHKSDFPTLSESVTRVQALSEAETESLSRLCDEILKDVALTQKLLRVVNTAHFRRAGSDAISTVSRAVALVGVGNIRNLAMSLMLVEHMEDKHHAQQLKEEFLRTVMAGVLASELCTNATDAEQAYIEALFRNLGRLLVGFYLPEDAQQVRDLVQGKDGAPPLSEARASTQILGMAYEALGVAVGKTWSLPETLLLNMTSPPGPLLNKSMAARPERRAWLASLANEVANAMLDSEPAQLGDTLAALTKRFEVPLDLTLPMVLEAAARAKKRLTEVSQVLNLKLPADSQAERLLESYYVDAPNAGATNAVTPEALGLGLAQVDEDGALALARPEPSLASVDILTSGIQDVTNTLVDSFQLNQVLGMILETVYRALDCRRVVFCLRDTKSASLIGRIGLGQGADQLKSVFQIPIKATEGAPVDLFTAVCVKGVDTLIADASAASVASRLPGWFVQRVQAPTFLLLPMTMKRQGQLVVLGMIYADREEADSLNITQKELSLLHTLRAQAIMAFKQSTGG